MPPTCPCCKSWSPAWHGLHQPLGLPLETLELLLKMPLAGQSAIRPSYETGTLFCLAADR
jgi:hypothetical protein